MRHTTDSGTHGSHHWWIHLVCMLPVLALVLAALFGMTIPGWFVPLVLILCIVAMFSMMAGHGRRDRESTGVLISKEDSCPEPDAGIDLQDVFAPTSRRRIGDVVVFEGQLAGEPEDTLTELESRFAGTGTLPILQEDEFDRPVLVLVPRKMFETRSKDRSVWINLGLFLATIATTTWAGALHQGVNLLEQPQQFTVGLPYALGLMLILGAHELGHYYAARAHGMKVTLPYFIPVPFALGTFGAFIQLRSPSANRRALFDVGVAGPLAGLVFAIPALFIGLGWSEVSAATENHTGMFHDGANVGSSVLFAAVAKLSLGEALTQSHVVVLHPLAFAGWLGLIVTALNLLPIGQLDGGHIADAMFGSRISNSIGMIAMFSLFALGLFVWSGLLFWAFIVYFIAGRKGIPPLNNVTRLSPGRMAVGWFAFAILLAILAPVPHALYEALGIHCPYL